MSEIRSFLAILGGSWKFPPMFWPRRHFLTFALIVSAFAGGTEVEARTTLRDLGTAEVMVKARNYQRAIDTVEPMLKKLELSTVEEIILAHRVLGVSYCELGDPTKAKEHFQALLVFSPSESVDDLVKTKTCSNLFAEARVASQAQAAGAASSLSEQEPIDPAYWKRYVPFGVGQFANRQNRKGWLFLGIESAAVAVGVTSFILFDNEKEPGGTFANGTAANIYRGLVWGSIGVGAGAMVWGIVDAVRVYKSRTAPTARRIRVTPAGLAFAF